MEGSKQGKECREDNEENKGRVRNKIRRKRHRRKGRERNTWDVGKGGRVEPEGRMQMNRRIRELRGTEGRNMQKERFGKEKELDRLP